VEGATALAEAGAELNQGLQLIKGAGLDALRDAYEILGDHSPCAKVQVPDLAIAHLAFGQAHSQTA
jgi:hypothetical protein